MIPRGYDPDRDLIGCPECGEQLDAEWVEERTLAERDSLPILVSLRCPSSRTHEVDAAYDALKVVAVAHRDRSELGSCTLLALPHWRKQGWYPTDPEHQTSTEMVEARIREQSLSGSL
jgi:hypothetical protein